MPRIRWAAHLLAAALFAVNWSGSQYLAVPGGDPLEGTWVIVSVQRDGEPDPSPVGGSVTFAAGSVAFQPDAVFTPVPLDKVDVTSNALG